MTSNLCCSALFCLAAGSAFADSGASLESAAYSAPAAFEVAPGQVVTLFFKGIKPGPDGQPRTGGLSAYLFQASAGQSPVPILRIRQENQCGDTQPMHPGCLLTAVQVQIPFDLALDLPGLAQLRIDEDGEPSRPFLLQPVAVSAHVLTSCDLAWDARPGIVCNRLAFHSDGTAVEAQRPARPSETIVVYAYGLGPVWPPAEAGKPTPAAIDVPQSGVLRVWAHLRNQPLNAVASAPRYYDVEAAIHAGDALQSVSLARERVGAYELKLVVPDSFETVLPCGGEIRANATALITTRQGSETVPLCIGN